MTQQGSAKAFLPAVQEGAPEVVFLNTSGGITGGDRLDYELTLGEGVHAVATTQTAERIYASVSGGGSASVRLAVARGGSLDWLPQETIAFDHAALSRTTTIDLAADARCLLAEILVLGRTAMGEAVRRIALRDMRLVRRAGLPVFVDPLALDDEAAGSDRPALLRGGRALAVVALLTPGAEAAADAVRRLRADDLDVAVSGWDGRCVVRVIGPDGWPVRRHVARILAVLRGRRPLPRVWQL